MLITLYGEVCFFVQVPESMFPFFVILHFVVHHLIAVETALRYRPVVYGLTDAASLFADVGAGNKAASTYILAEFRKTKLEVFL